MAMKPAFWRTILLGVTAVNLAGVGLAAGAAEGAHAALHAALAVVFGLWAERLRGRHAGGAGDIALDRERLDVLEGEVGTLRRELGEAQERLDFAERLLAQARDTERLPRRPEGGQA